MLSIQVPIDLGELGDFQADVCFTYTRNMEGIFIIIHEILVNGINILSIDRPAKLIADTTDYIICIYHPAEGA